MKDKIITKPQMHNYRRGSRNDGCHYFAGYGIDTCILEHTSRIGTKILQTGNGKCNFTNLNMNKSMYQNKDTQWVMDVIDRFNVADTLEFLKSWACIIRKRTVMYIRFQ